MKKIRYMKKTFIYLLFSLCFLVASSFIPCQGLDLQESPGKINKVHAK